MGKSARRIAILVAWAYVMEAIAIDDALDVLDLLVKDILAQSEREGKKNRLLTLKDLDAAALQLSTACQVIVNPSTEDSFVNVLVLWNTYYLDAGLNQLRSEGWEIKDEDLARLSLFAYSHINMLGRSQFHLAEELKDGAMRPLRNDESRDELADLELW